MVCGHIMLTAGQQGGEDGARGRAPMGQQWTSGLLQCILGVSRCGWIWLDPVWRWGSTLHPVLMVEGGGSGWRNQWQST